MTAVFTTHKVASVTLVNSLIYNCTKDNKLDNETNKRLKTVLVILTICTIGSKNEKHEYVTMLVSVSVQINVSSY